MGALESVLVTHPEILECGIAAVQDEQWGERPKAFITIKQGSSLTSEQMIQWCKDHRGISRFMVPRSRGSGGTAKDEHREDQKECAQGLGQGRQERALMKRYSGVMMMGKAMRDGGNEKERTVLVIPCRYQQCALGARNLYFSSAFQVG